METMQFDSLKLITIPVKLEGKWYALCEASEAAVRAHQGASMSGIELDMTKIDATSQSSIKDSLKNSIKSFDPSKTTASGPLVLSMCLKHGDYDEEAEEFKSIGAPAFTQQEIEGWSPKVFNPLLAKLNEISELDKGPKENPFLGVGRS